MEVLLLNFQDLCVDHKKFKKTKIADWIPPLQDSIKFNVDGSSRVKLEPAGIGGVLRDFNGRVLCFFSFSMGILDSNEADVLASKKAWSCVVLI